MTDNRRQELLTPSLLLWWTGLTVVLWIAGYALGQPAGLLPCAGSAALFVAIGEAGNAVRRRIRAGRKARRI
ncbi:hypothetical protein ACWD4V_21550 [Streptomyces tsukubensis]|uniref:hypothetical protein n=1 Tax=Streptomyces tsukubensis TaxID=83656 RepID=UPI0036B208D0